MRPSPPPVNARSTSGHRSGVASLVSSCGVVMGSSVEVHTDRRFKFRPLIFRHSFFESASCVYLEREDFDEAGGQPVSRTNEHEPLLMESITDSVRVLHKILNGARDMNPLIFVIGMQIRVTCNLH